MLGKRQRDVLSTAAVLGAHCCVDGPAEAQSRHFRHLGVTNKGAFWNPMLKRQRHWGLHTWRPDCISHKRLEGDKEKIMNAQLKRFGFTGIVLLAATATFAGVKT